MYPKLKINVYFIFLNIGDLTFGITLVFKCTTAAGQVKLNNNTELVKLTKRLMLKEWLSYIRIFIVLQASIAANVQLTGHLVRKKLKNLLKPLMFLAGTSILTASKKKGD
jgi:hypothetical protein